MAMLNNQMVRCIKQLLNGVYVAQVATVTGLATAAFAFRKNAVSDFKPQTDRGKQWEHDVKWPSGFLRAVWARPTQLPEGAERWIARGDYSINVHWA